MKKHSLYRWIILILCLVIINPQGIIIKLPAALAATSGTVTATSLNVRSGPGISYDKVMVNGSYAYLKKGEKLSILSEKSGWYKISFTFSGKKVKGYVMDDYVKAAKSTAPAPTPPPADSKSKNEADFTIPGTITATNLNVRQKPGITSKKIASIPKNQKVTILRESIQKSKKWYHIRYKRSGKTKTGYVMSDYVKLTLSKSVKAAVNSKERVKLKTGAGDKYKFLVYKISKKTVTLKNKKALTITKEVTDSKGKKWFKVSFTVSQVKYSGYIPAVQVLFTAETSAATPTPTVTPTPTAAPPEPTEPPIPTETPEPTETPTPTETPEPTEPPVPTEAPTPADILTDEEFELSLESEGFPESYKPYLMELHQMYPAWVFEAFHTGLDWDTVIESESTLGVNLISNGKGVEWKSLEPGAYNWSTDGFIPFDGSTWVTPSKQALEYYIDPRNFLTEKSIFQFELLTYKEEYQDVTGVEGILYNTPLYNFAYSYEDDTGCEVEHTYSQTFIDAAQYSGVSPYHLASRAKQEVVTGATTLSTSVSGTVSGLEGLYNFYNIGAYHSTAPGGAVANGLKYAQNGTTDQTRNALYLIPWDNPYDSILGGAYIIGSNYIKRGQDTIYLQKFNMTTASTFAHQYMANIEAPNAEAVKTYTAYSLVADNPIVFSIPVYENMPEEVSPLPEAVYNPNNWLKTLKVDGYNLTPTFDLTKDQTYSLIVEPEVDEINITAAAVSKKASVYGTGWIPLEEGENTIIITVMAENGDIRDYLIDVVKEPEE